MDYLFILGSYNLGIKVCLSLIIHVGGLQGWRDYFKNSTLSHIHFKPIHLIHFSTGGVKTYRAWRATWTCYKLATKLTFFCHHFQKIFPTKWSWFLKLERGFFQE